MDTNCSFSMPTIVTGSQLNIVIFTGASLVAAALLTTTGLKMQSTMFLHIES